jgi:hypothetical protein
MPPKAPPNVTTRTASSTLGAGQTQDTPIEPPLESEPNDDLDDASVAQLKEQIRTLTRGWRDDQEIMRQILDQVATLTAAAQQNPIRPTRRDSPSSTDTQDRALKYSKKQPDLVPLSDGTDPTFKSWKLQI